MKKIAAFFVGNNTPIFSLVEAKKVSLEYGGNVTNEEGEVVSTEPLEKPEWGCGFCGASNYSRLNEPCWCCGWVGGHGGNYSISG